MFNFKKCSTLKNVQILKLFKFKTVQILKFVQFWKCSNFTEYSISKNSFVFPKKLLDFKNGNINRKDKTAKRKEKGKKSLPVRMGRGPLNRPELRGVCSALHRPTRSVYSCSRICYWKITGDNEFTIILSIYACNQFFRCWAHLWSSP
jgi:hypothetical protein